MCDKADMGYRFAWAKLSLRSVAVGQLITNPIPRTQPRLDRTPRTYPRLSGGDTVGRRLTGRISL